MERLRIKKIGQVIPPLGVKFLSKYSKNYADRDNYCANLHRAGWTYTAIAAAAGLSRERVRQIVEACEADNAVREHAVPIPGTHPAARRAPETPKPLPENVAALKMLQRTAQSVRGVSAQGREAAEEYTRLVAHEHLTRGVSLAAVARAVSDEPDVYGSVTHSGLASRLKRYGYVEVVTPNRAYAAVQNRVRVSPEA